MKNILLVVGLGLGIKNLANAKPKIDPAAAHGEVIQLAKSLLPSGSDYVATEVEINMGKYGIQVLGDYNVNITFASQNDSSVHTCAGSVNVSLDFEGKKRQDYEVVLEELENVYQVVARKNHIECN